MSPPITSTRSGTWPAAMTYLAGHLHAQGIALACSPDPSTKPDQSVLLVQQPGERPRMGFVDRTLIQQNDRAVLDALLAGFTPMLHTTVEMLGERYVSHWQGHHRAAAALTLWWDTRMAEGYTVEAAHVMLELLAHRDIASRTVIDEFEGHTRAWLNYNTVAKSSR